MQPLGTDQVLDVVVAAGLEVRKDPVRACHRRSPNSAEHARTDMLKDILRLNNHSPTKPLNSNPGKDLQFFEILFNERPQGIRADLWVDVRKQVRGSMHVLVLSKYALLQTLCQVGLSCVVRLCRVQTY